MNAETAAHSLLDLSAPKTRRVCLALVVAAIVLGAGLRGAVYASRPSYWNDEAAIVVNVMRRDCRQLTRPLEYAQVAPAGFLWVERGLFRAFGAGEWGLRAWPFALGVLALPLFGMLAWRTLPPTSAAWAVALLAFSDKAIGHANEVKQYSGDVFVAIAILCAAAAATRTGCAGRRALTASAVAAVGIWFSFPAVFLYGGLSAVLLCRCVKLGGRSVIAWAAGNALVAGSFIGLYAICLRNGHDPSLQTFWADSFPPDWHRLPEWLVRQLYGIADYPVESFGWITGVFLVLGGIALVKMRRGAMLAVLPATLGVALVAAAAHRYPFPGHHRLSLYLMPLLLLWIGAGAEPQNLQLRGWLARWYFLLVVPLLGISVAQAVKHLVSPEESSTTRQVVKWLKAHRSAGEPIVLAGDALAPGPATGRNVELLCYWPRPAGEVIEGFVPAERVNARRFWVVYSLKRPETGGAKFADQLRERMRSGLKVLAAEQHGGQSGAMLLEKP